MERGIGPEQLPETFPFAFVISAQEGQFVVETQLAEQLPYARAQALFNT